MVDESVVQFQTVVKSPESFRLAIEDSANRESRYCEVSSPFAIIGRSRKCDIRLEGEDVADCHAYLQFIDGHLLWVELCTHDGSHRAHYRTQSGWLTPNTFLRVGTHTIRRADSRYTSAKQASDLGPDFNPLRKYRGETGPLPRVAVDFLNGSTNRPICSVGRVLTLVGNSPNCKFCLDTSSVSEMHCGLLLTPDGLWVIDLLGRGGTAVNNQLIRCCKLEDGDKLQVGPVQMRIRYEDVNRKRRQERLIESVVSAGLHSQDEMDRFLARLNGAQLTRTELTRKLIDDGLLTAWQAQQVISSRRRRLLLERRYQLLEPLGSGAMAKMFRARDSELRRDVAIKFPHSVTGNRAKLTERVRREFLINRTLDHPNIARTLDVAKDGSFFVMEYIDGENLLQRVRRTGPLKPTDAVSFVEQVTEAVILAYRRGILHRDIKPSNIMVTSDKTAKLLDFGLAAHEEEFKSSRTAAREQFDRTTMLGRLAGTVRYMAPELTDPSHPVDTRSDIYSLGCTLYELIAGHSPYDASSPVEMMLKHTQEPIPKITNIDPQLQSILSKALAKDPEQRYQTPIEFLAALQEWRTRYGALRDRLSHRQPECRANAKTLDDGSRLTSNEQDESARRYTGDSRLSAAWRQYGAAAGVLRQRRAELDACTAEFEADRISLVSERKLFLKRQERFEQESASERGELATQRMELQKQRQTQEAEQQRLQGELTEALAQFEIRDQEWLQSCKQREDRRKRTEDELHTARESLHRDKSDLNVASERFEHAKMEFLKSERRQFEDDQASLQEGRSRLSDAQQELEERAILLEQSRRHLDEERAGVGQSAADVDNQHMVVDQQRKQLVSQTSALHMAQKQLQEKRRELDQSRKTLQDDRESLQDQQDRADEADARVKSQLEAIGRNEADIRKIRVDLENERQVLKAGVGKLNQDMAELVAQRKQLQIEIATYDDNRNTFEIETRRMQEQHSRSVAEHKALVDREAGRLAELQKQFDKERLAFQSERAEFMSEVSQLCGTYMKRLSGSQPD